MRFLMAAAAAVFVSLCIFGFMQSLIKNDYRPLEKVTEFTEVEFIKQKEDELKPEEEMDASRKSETNPEQMPDMPRLDVLMQRSLSPIPSEIALQGAPEPLDLVTGFEEGMPVLATVSVAGDGGSLMPGKGLIEQGTEQLRPFAAVRPNIPQQAYEKRINGWVIASFTVVPKGKVINISILDAHPRGLFEDEAVKALSKWVYPVNEKGRASRVTQRLEFSWKNYRENIKNL